MDSKLLDYVCQATGAVHCELGTIIQPLWSGYGVLQKVTLVGDQRTDAIVKWVDLSKMRVNQRGWSGSTSHDRKVKSYEVEKNFYQSYRPRCKNQPRVASLLGAMPIDNEAGWVIVLEDLDAAGFSNRKTRLRPDDVGNCIDWIADFHATFFNDAGAGLWEQGTYWHLETRPDEFAAMGDGPLKRSAAALDDLLKSCRYQTLLHGDAKIANFCFPDDATGCENQKTDAKVAAVDFQYVGRGCGMKDVVYFLTSCLSDEQCEQKWESILDRYFDRLSDGLSDRLNEPFHSFSALEQQWRAMFPVAWADFNRFLTGWSPGHWKLTAFSERMTTEALAMLER